ncbi:hypothetical protein BS329_37710 [Amycolatopsis coloradensis]|uniref:Uncharacterized protein n=1 Tax=Amycolatopsis coloradensis TaxID=76021 RepID=A0A1R0KFK7_9PSEU|nr:hypothetical protein [Amycolatopsis coloradensis]OLZ44164.1 hypothetical protein BS329_37710 [Amycolatopsis coloradensis]
MLTVRDISYLVAEASADDMQRDLKVIAREPHRTAVMLLGGDQDWSVGGRAVGVGAGRFATTRAVTATPSPLQADSHSRTPSHYPR